MPHALFVNVLHVGSSLVTSKRFSVDHLLVIVFQTLALSISLRLLQWDSTAINMWEPVILPFKNGSLPLPALPTTDEILAFTNVLWDHMHKVVAVSDEVVVKFGREIRVSEGQTLIYFERHAPQVPAPRLYPM
ncbi:uncharacterized protein BDV17DRAFT_287191 [Aspergillus undulatus]|uniref:uncharacterized protein n=1 Tax=Aspergillus undulatus TaxID=1810928 RepID=UPI003CCDC9B8